MRSCLIIYRFSETEAIAVITTLILHYEVRVKEEPRYAEESFEQKKARVLACMPGISLT